MIFKFIHDGVWFGLQGPHLQWQHRSEHKLSTTDILKEKPKLV